MNHSIEIVGTTLFAIAVLHSFVAAKILDWSHEYEVGSWQRSVLHLLGEVEVVFGFWGALFLLFMALFESPQSAIDYQNSIHFTEPLFVFAIMVMASTKPVLELVRHILGGFSRFLSKLFKTDEIKTDLFVVLVFGPLFGSLITEPAAMTVTALLLSSMIVSLNASLMIALMATLFVNVSIGGALTSFAAPPILMVANTWNWDTAYVFQHFGLKSLTSVLLNTVVWLFIFRNQISTDFHSLREVSKRQEGSHGAVPMSLSLFHFAFLIFVVILGHHPSMFMGVFLFFLGLTTATQKYQSTLRFREALLVAFFLAGIMIFGPVQKWWLQPLLSQLNDFSLFAGATVLTGFTDNAALTYLGSQVSGLSVEGRFSLVAGAICGGGLSLIANAPNAAGYAILRGKMGESQFSALQLFLWALIPTLIATTCFWFLPH